MTDETQPILSLDEAARRLDQALSRLVTRLVHRGLVTRTRSTRSNREVAVKLSAKGTALVGRLIPIAHDYETVAIAGLSPQELAALKRCRQFSGTG